MTTVVSYEPELAQEVRVRMLIPLLVLLAIIVILGGGGFLSSILWWVLIAAVVLWLLGFLVRSGEGGRWYYW
jgi:hypothetical protein